MNNIHIIFLFSFFILINIFDKIVLIIESFRKMTKLNIRIKTFIEKNIAISYK